MLWASARWGRSGGRTPQRLHADRGRRTCPRRTSWALPHTLQRRRGSSSGGERVTTRQLEECGLAVQAVGGRCQVQRVVMMRARLLDGRCAVRRWSSGPRSRPADPESPGRQRVPDMTCSRERLYSPATSTLRLSVCWFAGLSCGRWCHTIRWRCEWRVRRWLAVLFGSVLSAGRIAVWWWHRERRTARTAPPPSRSRSHDDAKDMCRCAGVSA